MNILTGSPQIYRPPLDEQAQNVAIGQSFASSFLNGFNRGVDQRREDQRWNELAPLRQAQLSAANANAQSAVSRSQLEAIQAANAAKQESKIADFAGLAGEVAERGYEDGDRIRMYEFLKKNPEFYGSKFHQQLEGSFNNAAKARADEEEWRTKEAVRITEERIRQETAEIRAQGQIDLENRRQAGDVELQKLRNQGLIALEQERAKGRPARSSMTEEDKIFLRGEIDGLKADPKMAVPGWFQGELAKLAKRYNKQPASMVAEVYEEGPVEGPEGAPATPQPAQGNRIKLGVDASGKVSVIGGEQPKAAKVVEDIVEAGPEFGPNEATESAELKSLKDAVINKSSKEAQSDQRRKRGENTPTRQKLLDELAKAKGVEPSVGSDQIGSSRFTRSRNMTPAQRVAANPDFYGEWLNNLPVEEQIRFYRRVLGND